MNIVKAGYEIMPIKDVLKKIELVARTCYKSEDLITEDSCIRMVESLIKRQHYAMLEHASLIFNVDPASYGEIMGTILALQSKKAVYKIYLNLTDYDDNHIVSGNIRAWIEFLNACVKIYNKIPAFFKQYLDDNKTTENTVLFKDFYNIQGTDYTGKDCWYHKIDDVTKLSIDERLVHQTLSAKFTSDLLIQRELVRHRDASFAGESTRYCNYSLDKFGNEITVIEPCFFDPDEEKSITKYAMWQTACEDAEETYFDLLKAGATPQEARAVLPVATKCDTVVTANIREWIHILELRALGTTGKPHPQMLEIMVPLAKELASGLLSDFTCIDSVSKMLEL